ncbi:hypothetical protein PTQ21_12345 [Paenibacillus marchantiae]|uniref:hypothetical protein n=1 Tax=Paenibacillus marchantiae TaxID=3026433 RepID=UPI00237A8FEB|nr:hypothetical protein [Paenibacillus marchantiae]WDQ34977.1 hypothetical protein PTQ21_12345 [Paenibacillus marchantiae]
MQRINNELLRNPVDIEPEQLAHGITQGKTFVPAYITTKVDGSLRRTKDCWTSQQVICMDFDNGYYDRTLKQKVMDVRITWEEAQEEFKASAMFMYKTFSHTDDWPKFRVVFAFNEPFTDINLLNVHTDQLFKEYPYADESTFQVERLFFGGTDLHVFDYENRLQINHDLVIEGGYYSPNYYSNNIDIIEVTVSPLTTSEIVNTYINNIDMIQSLNVNIIERMKTTYKPITVSSRKEVYDYLKKINLHEYIGIASKQFHDIFHNESSPSANIYQDPKTGYWWYKCWSSSHPFTGTIIEVTEWLTKLNKPKSLRYLMECFNITIQKSEWHVEMENLIQQNLELLNDEEFIKEAYPNLNSLLRTPLYYSVLREIHLIALENISTLIHIEDTEEAVFFASINYIMKRLDRWCDFDRFKNSKERRIRTILSLLVYLQLLNRIDIERLPFEYVNRAKLEAQKKHYQNMITFWTIPSMAATHMHEVEMLAKQFKDLGMTVGNFDRQMVLKTLGEEEANRIFPMRKNEQLSRLNEHVCEQLEKTCLNYITEYGWVTEHRIIENTYLEIEDVEAEMRKRDKRIKDSIVTEEDKLKWLYELKRRQLKKIIGGLMINHGLSKQKLNNKLMEERDIPLHYNENGNPSYPVVYFTIE